MIKNNPPKNVSWMNLNSNVSFVTFWWIKQIAINLINKNWRREYVCHQCYYNTSCSRSFEFHLHGHLNKKRTALWNKNVNTGYDEYSCPCGFQLSSTTGKSSSIANKIADHLNICEYKYCFCRTKPDSTGNHWI